MSGSTSEKKWSAARKGCLVLVIGLALLFVAVVAYVGVKALKQRQEATELARQFVLEKCWGGEVTDVTAIDAKYDAGCGEFWDVPGYRVSVTGCAQYQHVEVACLPFAESCSVTTGVSVHVSDCGTTF